MSKKTTQLCVAYKLRTKGPLEHKYKPNLGKKVRYCLLAVVGIIIGSCGGPGITEIERQHRVDSAIFKEDSLGEEKEWGAGWTINMITR